LATLPVTGAAISTLGSLAIAPETLCASDAQAAQLDELQFDLGEGPCWQAKKSLRPVLEPDVRAGANTSWPAFSSAIQETPVRAMFAFPLMIGPLVIGIVDLYSLAPGSLGSVHENEAERLARVASRQVLRAIVGSLSSEPDEAESRSEHEFSRRRIHQATGMVIARLQLSAEAAALVLRAHAFSVGRPVREIAEDVLAWRLDFSATDDDAVNDDAEER
jgi:hypothetical protein